VLDRRLRLLLAKANDVVMCVDEKLINQLVESGVDGQSCSLEGLSVSNEDLFGCGFNAADIGVGKREDVFAVRLLLVGGEV
jgi:hypothetical protein